MAIFGIYKENGNKSAFLTHACPYDYAVDDSKIEAHCGTSGIHRMPLACTLLLGNSLTDLLELCLVLQFANYLKVKFREFLYRQLSRFTRKTVLTFFLTKKEGKQVRFAIAVTRGRTNLSRQPREA
jgi:hypothetical protein